MSELFLRRKEDGTIEEYRRGDKPGAAFMFTNALGKIEVNHYPTNDQLTGEGFALCVCSPCDNSKYMPCDPVEDGQGGWVQGVVELPIETLRRRKEEEIEAAFISACAEPITYNGVSYPGGYEYADMRENGRELIRRGIEAEWVPADSTVGFYDIDGNEIELTLDQANHVILLNGFKYQADLSKKKSLLRDIKAAQNLNELEGITWNG